MRLFLALMFLFSINAFAVELDSFKKTVASTATPECLVGSSSELRAADIGIQALDSNTGGVWVGDSTVTNTGPGIRIEAKQLLSLSNILKQGSAQHFTLKDICLAVEVNGEGVTVTYSVVNP
jgi:hypothetical protein